MLKKCVILLLVISLLVMCGVAVSAKTFIRLGTAGSGGNYYRLGAGMASLWNDLFPDLQVSIQATKGSANNVDLLADKEVEISFLSANPAYQSYNNEGQWADREKGRYENMRFMSHVYPNPQNFVAMEWAPDIKSVRDLKGKRVSVGMLGSTGENSWKKIMEILGWTYDDIVEEFTVHQTAIDQVRNRQIDAVIWPDAAGSASFTEIMQTGFARFVDLDDDIIEGMTKEMDFPFTLPAGAFPGQDKPVKTFAGSAVLAAREDVPEDIIYKLVKSMYENQEFLINVHPITKYMVLEQALNGQPFPLHPGAEKYYREMGVIK